MVPWESARYQPILTLSFLSSSTYNSIMTSISTLLTSLITSLTTSPSLPSSITTLSYRHEIHDYFHIHKSQLTSRKLIGLLICGLSTLRNHSWGSIESQPPSYLQLLVPQLKRLGGLNEHLLTGSHPCPP